MPELSVSSRRKDFDRFVYSVIREEEGGAYLTVLSILARHNLDPWEAAEQLTRIPRRVAVARSNTPTFAARVANLNRAFICSRA
jgi:hypothetical protein